jgi:hypothetical protein
MASEWIKHVKQYAKEHKIKYGEALKQASSTFHSSAEPSNLSKVVVKSRKVQKSRKSNKNRSRKNRTARRR